MSKQFKIPVTWQMYGYVIIEADDLHDAIIIAKNSADELALPDGDYISDSFEIDDSDYAVLEELNK